MTVGVNIKRVAIGTIAVMATTLASIHVVNSLRREPVPEPPVEPWIPVPPNGMDATETHVRELLLSISESGGLNSRDALAWQCGPENPGDPVEKYVAYVGDPVLWANARAMKVSMTIHGSSVEVAVKDASLPPPPPQPSPNNPPAEYLEFPTAISWVDKADLADIRRAWLHPSLWAAPQGPVRCMDGQPLFLEACVFGRYMARARHCASTDGAATALFEVLQKHFKAPAPYFRRSPPDSPAAQPSASGN